MSHVLLPCLFTICLAFPAVTEAAADNCHDPDAWIDWQERVSQHPDDQELQGLHALWIGLCFTVETGAIPVDDAITIFENARNTVIQKRQEEKQGKQQPASL